MHGKMTSHKIRGLYRKVQAANYFWGRRFVYIGFVHDG
jgi:hypothetical protein